METAELMYAGVLSSGIPFFYVTGYLGSKIYHQHLSLLFFFRGCFLDPLHGLVLDQYLNEFKIFGIIIILSAVIFSQLAPMYGKRKYGETSSGYAKQVGWS